MDPAPSSAPNSAAWCRTSSRSSGRIAGGDHAARRGQPPRAHARNVSWASAGLDTGRPGYTLGVTPQPHNEGDFTALGRVVRGMDAVDSLELGDAVTAARMVKYRSTYASARTRALGQRFTWPSYKRMAGVSAGHSSYRGSVYRRLPVGFACAHLPAATVWCGPVCGTWSLSLFLSTVSTRGASDLSKIAQVRLNRAQGSGLRQDLRVGFVVHAISDCPRVEEVQPSPVDCGQRRVSADPRRGCTSSLDWNCGTNSTGRAGGFPSRTMQSKASCRR